MRRTLLAVAALAIPISGVTLALSGPASAKSAKITCTSLSGNAAGTSTISGCTGGSTGGGSQPLSSATLEAGGVVTWLNGQTTTLNAPTIKTTKAKKCPVAGSSADTFKAVVSADSGTGVKVPGTATGAVCVSPTGAISALKPLKIT
jgi:hypothetical protein